MAATSRFFAKVKTPFQRKYAGVVSPAVLSPTTSPSALPAVVKNHEEKTWLESVLHRHGAILFRGFDSLATASDFNDVVEAFGYEELPYVGGFAPRNKVVGRVFTANESPPHRKIHFHHEMSHVVGHYPSKVFFFCEEEATSGGETALLVSHFVYERMKEKHVEFVEKLEKVGLKYTQIMEEEDDISSEIGRGWKSTFRATDKIAAEQRAAKLKMKLEWMDEGRVKTTVGPLPGIKYDEMRQRKIWFNSMATSYTSCGNRFNDPKKMVCFGDGSPLPEDIMHDYLNFMEEECVDVPWQKGDILMIDNLAVLHSRKPFTPPRRILAALCK